MAQNGNAYGTLFAQYYLEVGIRDDPDWAEVSAEELADRLRPIYERFPTDKKPNESQTEEELIWPVLRELGWTSYLRQQNLSVSGRNLAPDGLLFLDETAKERADEHEKEWKRYGHGVALVESKCWSKGEGIDKSLDLGNGGVAAATQMLNYLRRADVLTEGKLKWGILTDGMLWRLYWQDARSVSNQYFQINLAHLLGYDYGGRIEEELSDEEKAENMRLLKIFSLVFRRQAFHRTPSSQMTFHERALRAGKAHEARVVKSLSDKVFSTVFPSLANAIHEAAPDAPLLEIRDSGLTFLYRLLFVFFAEDRRFLPVGDRRYDRYSLREKVRMDVKKRKEVGAFSDKLAIYWSIIDDHSKALEHGDASIGLPPYNGGLFDSGRMPLLSNLRIPDSIMADIIDELSFEVVDGERRYINYRNLSTHHLGTIYEKLLEYDLILDPDAGLVLHPNVYARKLPESHLTPDDLIRLVVRETLDPILQEIREKFRKAVDSAREEQCPDAAAEGPRLVDPAYEMLKIRVCDPAMGSGRFLVDIVDYLSDQIVEAMAEVESLAEREDGPRYSSRLYSDIHESAMQIRSRAKDEGWLLREEQIDDQRMVRRIVLNRCVYGVDKNDMAVELAKASLWLHSFTMCAPLSFIDHHLRVGDSLFGEWVECALDRLTRHSLLIGDEIEKAKVSAKDMQFIDKLNDLEIAEVRNQAQSFERALRHIMPLDTLMSALHALRWMKVDDKMDEKAVNCWLDGVFGNPVRMLLEEPMPTPDNDSGAASNEPLAENGNDGVPHSPIISEKQRLYRVLSSVKRLIAEEKFFNWEVSFLGIWGEWGAGSTGGFDAVIGDPPWDRMSLQEMEWLAIREPSIDETPSTAQRKMLARSLKRKKESLAQGWERARRRSETMVSAAKECGEYPKTASSDVKVHSLFLERGMSLLKPGGMLGLLTPTEILSEGSSSQYVSEIANDERLAGIYDFRNGKLLPGLDSDFRFCAIVSSKTRKFKHVKCAFRLDDTGELVNPGRVKNQPAQEFNVTNIDADPVPMDRG